MSKFQTPRGTRDFLPRDMVRREYIFRVIKSVFERFGFAPLETPAFEDWKLLSRKGSGGDEIKDEIYYFRDKSKRELGLRFDLTVPLARVVANNPQLPKPFKRYQIGRVWRYDRPQAGRFREFWQADADVIGSASMAAEAECIAVFITCLRELGFRDFEVRLNNRKLLNGMIEVVDVDKKKAPAVFRALDKLEKRGEEEVKKELKRAGVKPKQIETLMKMIKMSGKPEGIIRKARKMLEGFSEAEEGLKELEEIVNLSKSYGTAERIIIDFSLVRGLDYYTGPVFEIFVKAEKEIGSVAGGGRYDNLIELYRGTPTSATGGSFGIERIYEIMFAENMFKGIPSSKTRVFVAAARDEPRLKKAAMETVQKLRKEGIPAETDLMGRKLKQCLDYADRLDIPYMVIIGEKELRSDRLTLRDMKKREQKIVVFERVLKELKK